MFKEFGDLRHIVNFKRVIFPISIAFFIYTFGWGITSPIFDRSIALLISLSNHHPRRGR
jgi:hypothetical protein